MNKKIKTIRFFLAIITLLGLVFLSTAYMPGVPSHYNLQLTNKSNFEKYNLAYFFVNQDPDPVQPGDTVEVRWKLENLGQEPVTNVIVELIPEYPFKLYPGFEATKKIGSIDSMQRGSTGPIIYYKLLIDDKAKSGDYPIKIRYSPDNGYSWISQTFYIRVRQRESLLSIENVSTTPKQIPPGSKAELKIKIKNNINLPIKNLRVNLKLRKEVITSTTYSVTELPFTPINSGNEKIIDYIAPKETKEIIFNLVADPDAEPKAYKLPLTLSFSDSLGRNFTQDLIIGVIVGGIPEIELSLGKTDIYTSGKKGTITIKCINKGNVEVKFLELTLKENDKIKVLSPKKLYIGNIDSDDYETADFNIYIIKTNEKNIKLPFVVSYKDANNNNYTKNIYVNLPLYSYSEMKRYGFIKTNKAVGFLIILVIVLGGLFFYRKIKKIKRK